MEKIKNKTDDFEMSPLGMKPIDWKLKKLGDIGKIRMCKRIFNNETTTDGDIPFYKIGTFGKEADAFISKELYENYKNRFSYPNKGDILISAAGTLGRTVVFDGSPGYFQDSNIVWIENDDKLVLNDFLFYVYQIIRYDSEGGTIQRLYNSIISDAKFLLPPLLEQQKIAAILTKWDELIGQQTLLIAAKEKRKKGLMQKLLTGEVRFPGFSGEWEELKMSDVFHVARGGSPRPIDQFITEDSDGLNWVKIGDTKGDAKYIFSTKQKIKKEGLSKTVKVEIDDFILSNSMSFGRPYIMKTDGCIHDGWLLLRRKADCSVDFMYYLLGSELLQEQYLSMAAGSAVKNLNKEIVSGVDLIIPCVDEQEKIAFILSSLDVEIGSLSTELDAIQKQKKGLMQQLLTGKIRVKV